MSEVNRTTKDRRSKSQMDIDALIASRSETLSAYSDLASHRPFDANEQFPNELKTFCQALIDYTASAHFQLYKHMVENTERRFAVVAVADEVYSAILKTTDLILTFNDRYGDDADIEKHMHHVEHDLSSLGEALADRIQNEDIIIDALYVDRREDDDADD